MGMLSILSLEMGTWTTVTFRTCQVSL